MKRKITAALIGIMASTAAASQEYPSHPIRLVTSEAGGGADFSARAIAQALSGGLGQQVVVDNRGSLPSIEIAAKAPPQGYVLLLAANTLWLLPLMQKVSFDPVRDFVPVSLLNSTSLMVVVHPAVPVQSVNELIALAKAKPGGLNYGSGSKGSSTQLAAELFKSMAGVNMTHVPYKGSGPAIIDLLGGQVQVMFGTSGVVPHVKAGRLRALAITSAQPSALFPGLPTVAASGVPGYQSVAMFGVFAPAKTPDAIIRRLNREIVRQLAIAEVKERFNNSGSDVVGSSPEEFAATIKSEMIRLGKVIKDAGIMAE